MLYKEKVDLMGLMPDKHLSGNSVNWKNWESKLKFTTCAECFKKHGTIYDTTFERDDIMPIHPNGLCELPFMRTKMAGTVTKLGPLGADAQLCYLKKLPDFYVTKKDALKSGWKRALGNLNDVLPGKSIGGDVFYNDLGKLPSEASRVWREADFDYIKGYRNDKRILYSNDGLLFATYDHYQTFYEILP